MPYKFPASDLDSAPVLLNQVGGFWSGSYSGNFLVESLLYARGRLEQQSHQDMLELVASMSRFKVPILHTDIWHMLRLTESERNQAEANFAKFDGTHTFDDGLVYDEPISTTYHVWQLPAGLVDALVITNRITEPSLTLIRGVDFFIKDGAIWFRENPFNSGLVAVDTVIENGSEVDRVCALWLYHSGWDKDAVETQFGYAVGIELPSSPPARDVVNAIYDGLVEGATSRNIKAMVSALTDVPFAAGEETVEQIFSDAKARWVITDQRAYPFHLNSTVIVNVGDVLRQGQALTDTLQFFEFNRGQVPDEIPALAVSKGFMAHGYFQDLVFENKEVDLLVEDDINAPTRISFEVGGNPADVDFFWTKVHEVGAARGQTLAMLLDQRPEESRDDKPTAMALPRVINPLAFLLQNVFRNNLFVIKLRSGLFGSRALGLNHARLLRRLVPPHTACILLVQLEPDVDEIKMDSVGSETVTGYEEEADVFLGENTTEELEVDDYIEEEVRLITVGGRCL